MYSLPKSGSLPSVKRFAECFLWILGKEVFLPDVFFTLGTFTECKKPLGKEKFKFNFKALNKFK